MKIRRSNNLIKFKDVEVGEVFIDEDGDIAMKIETILQDKYGKYNAVNIKNGELICIGDEENYHVKILDCELVIE